MLILSVLWDRGQSEEEEEVEAEIVICDPLVHCFPPCALICVHPQEGMVRWCLLHLCVMAGMGFSKFTKNRSKNSFP